MIANRQNVRAVDDIVVFSLVSVCVCVSPNILPFGIKFYRIARSMLYDFKSLICINVRCASQI